MCLERLSEMESAAGGGGGVITPWVGVGGRRGPRARGWPGAAGGGGGVRQWVAFLRLGLVWCAAVGPTA